MADWKDMLASLYGVGADAKNFLYDTGLLDSVSLQAQVLSVGNLSVGGTGKTPVVENILSKALERKIRTTVVSRNYQARSRGIQKVDVGRADGGFYYGDEAFFLAKKYPQSSVWTGPQKFLTAQKAEGLEKPKLVIVDDGFQHRALHRDFDLVLLDCTASLEEEELLPRGRLREDFASLQRASAVALTKVNWAPAHRMDSLKARIPKHLEIYEIEFHPTSKKVIETGSRVLSVSGIAKPQIFEKTLSGLGVNLFEVAETLVYPDHHAYTNQDVVKILERLRTLNCQQILTTEKDFVKLQTFPEVREFLNPILIATHFRQEPKGLYEFLDRSHCD